jgi:transcriptional regulator GlxA family with amidase domain
MVSRARAQNENNGGTLVAPPNNALSVEGCNIKNWLHPLAARVYDLAIERALSRPNVTTIAQALSRSTRQLERLFEQATLPPP